MSFFWVKFNFFPKLSWHFEFVLICSSSAALQENFKKKKTTSLTWHLAWFSSSQFLPFSLHFVLLTPLSEPILRQAVWCSKQKGLKALHQPPRLKTSSSKKNRNWLQKNNSNWTQTWNNFTYLCCQILSNSPAHGVPSRGHLRGHRVPGREKRFLLSE